MHSLQVTTKKWGAAVIRGVLVCVVVLVTKVRDPSTLPQQLHLLSFKKHSSLLHWCPTLRLTKVANSRILYRGAHEIVQNEWEPYGAETFFCFQVLISPKSLSGSVKTCHSPSATLRFSLKTRTSNHNQLLLRHRSISLQFYMSSHCLSFHKSFNGSISMEEKNASSFLLGKPKGLTCLFVQIKMCPFP